MMDFIGYGWILYNGFYIDFNFIGFDNIGIVSGAANGHSVLIFKENEKPLYTICTYHRLNLAISTSCKITSIRNLMNTTH